MARPTKVTDWFYDVKDLEVVEQEPSLDEGEEAPEPKRRVITKKVKVEVWMEKKTADLGGPPYALTGVSFTVKCDEPKFGFSGTDIELLRITAWGELDKQYEVKWENYYLVQVVPERIYEGSGSGLTFSYKHVYKGTTWDGKELMKEYGWNSREPKIAPWPGRFKDNAGRAIACIPDNEANKHALEEFAKRIDKLREMIRDTLKPEVIMQTLQNLAGMALLPPANPDDEDSTAEKAKRRKAS
jgi:hypothetical protein